MSKKKSILDGLLYFVNIVSSIALMGSYLTYYIDPSYTSVFAFLGLAYPFLLLINLLFAFYWLLRFKMKLVLPVLAISIGFLHTGRLYRFSSSSEVISSGQKIKVMSYNVRMFNRYQWIKSNSIPEQIQNTVAGAQPDILFIQEYYQSEKTPDFNFKNKFVKLTNEGKNYGLAIYSQLPIVNTGSLYYESDSETENHEFIYADIEWQGKVIRFINIHLASVGFDQTDYERIENPQAGSQDDIKRDVLQIAKRLNTAFGRRAMQVKSVEKAIEESPYPVVLCGDFNDTPHSYTYKKIDDLLKDSFMESGRGFGSSYAKFPIPLRIDFCFHSDVFRSSKYEVVNDQTLSDHHPILTELELL